MKNLKDRVTYIYFITDGEYTKIGMSNNPKERLAVLQVGNPKQLTVAYTLPYENRQHAKQVESLLHKVYEPYLIRGEWYKLPS